MIFTAFTTSELNSLTQRFIFPVLPENIYKSNAMLVKLRSRQVLTDGGSSLNVPVAIVANPNAVAYQGTQTLPSGFIEESTTAQLSWGQYDVTVTLPGLNIFANRGPEAVINMVKAKLALAERALRDLIGSDLFGTNTDAPNLAGLQVAIDDATNYVTYATINRSTFSNWQAVFSGNSGTGRALTLSLLETNYNSARIDAASPKLSPTDNGCFTKLWNLIQPSQRFFDENIAKIGFPNMMFNDSMVFVDSHVSATTGKEHFYFLNPEAMTLYTFRDMNFRFIPFYLSQTQDAYVAHIRVYMQLLVDQPRLNAKIIDLDHTL